jgi:E1A-binding protein p400
MELWSLLHFLMPHVFKSRKEFSYWFSNPMNSIVEGNSTRNNDLIKRLHGIIRPFVLRRLKKDVEKQMPGKYEHVLTCSLSRRQMFLYEEFMARSTTRNALGGNFLGMMNVLMQLRKVCNHPDLFEPRAILTPFVMDPISMAAPACAVGLFDRPDSTANPLKSLTSGLVFVDDYGSNDALHVASVKALTAPAK